MATNTYTVGAQPRLTATFTVSDVNTDPTTVTFKLLEPDGAITTYVYGTDAQLVKSAAGIYYVDWIATKHGKHHWRMAGTGACQAAKEGVFDVAESRF